MVGYNQLLPNFVGDANAAYEAGEQRADRRTLRDLMPQAMQGDPNAQAKIAAVSPQHAGLAQDAHTTKLKKIRGAAKYVLDELARGGEVAAARAQQQVAPFMSQLTGKQMGPYDPSQLDNMRRLMAETAWLEGADGGKPAQQQYAEWLIANAPPEERDQVMGVLGGYRARPSSAGIQFGEMQLGDMRTYANRKNPRTGEVEVLTDNGWVPLGGSGSPMGGAPAGGGMSGGSAPVSMSGGALPVLSSIAAKHGFVVTDGFRTDAQNAATPGSIPNSRHKNNNAVDLSVKGKTPQQLQAIDADMKANGFVGGYTTEGTAPHLHYEYRGSGGGLPSVASPTPGQIKADEVVGSEQAKVDVQVANADVIRDLEARLAAAKAQAEAEAKARGEIAADAGKRSSKANRVLTLLDEADRLIDGSTGSGLGARRDEAAGFFGQSTPGAENIAALRTLEGQLIAEMPRMEGPQSDADRLLYARSAGTLADPTIPVAQRKAASAAIRRLQQQYADGAPRPAAAPKRLKFNPATGRIE